MAAETKTRFYLERVNRKTGERAGRIDVTDRSERDRAKIEFGMIRNLHPDWYVDEVTKGGTNER